MLLDRALDHADVLIEQPRRARGVRLGLGRDLRLQLRLGLLRAGAARPARARLSASSVSRRACASRSACACSSRRCCSAFSAATRSCFLALRFLARALLVGDALLLALLREPLLLGGLAPLAVLALLALPFLARGFVALGLLALDGRLIDDDSLNRRRGDDRHARPLDAPWEADDDGRQRLRRAARTTI